MAGRDTDPRKGDLPRLPQLLETRNKPAIS